jgi:hypothetical protein
MNAGNLKSEIKENGENKTKEKTTKAGEGLKICNI